MFFKKPKLKTRSTVTHRIKPVHDSLIREYEEQLRITPPESITFPRKGSLMKRFALFTIALLVATSSYGWFTWSDNWALLHIAYVNSVNVAPNELGEAPDGITASLPLTVRVQIANDDLWDVEFNKVHLQYKVLNLPEPVPAVCPENIEETYRIDFHFEDLTGNYGNYNGMDYVIVSSDNPCEWFGISNSTGLPIAMGLDAENAYWVVNAQAPVTFTHPYKTHGLTPAGAFTTAPDDPPPAAWGVVSNVVVAGDPGIGGGTWRNFGHVYNSADRTFVFSPEAMPLGSQHLTIRHDDITYGAPVLIRIYAANTLTDPPYENASLAVDTDEHGTNGWKDYWVVLVNLAERTRPTWR